MYIVVWPQKEMHFLSAIVISHLRPVVHSLLTNQVKALPPRVTNPAVSSLPEDRQSKTSSTCAIVQTDPYYVNVLNLNARCVQFKILN